MKYMYVIPTLLLFCTSISGNYVFGRDTFNRAEKSRTDWRQKKYDPKVSKIVTTKAVPKPGLKATLLLSLILLSNQNVEGLGQKCEATSSAIAPYSPNLITPSPQHMPLQLFPTSHSSSSNPPNDFLFNGKFTFTRENSIPYEELRQEISGLKSHQKIEIGASNLPLCLDCHQISITDFEIKNVRKKYESYYASIGQEVPDDLRLELMNANAVGNNFQEIKQITYANGHLPSQESATNIDTLESFYKSLSSGGIVYIITVVPQNSNSIASFTADAHSVGFHVENRGIHSTPTDSYANTPAVLFKLTKP